MDRYLLLKKDSFANEISSITLECPVASFERIEEAIKWLQNQSSPDLYRIEDQFPDENEHDFAAYECRDIVNYE